MPPGINLVSYLTTSRSTYSRTISVRPRMYLIVSLVLVSISVLAATDCSSAIFNFASTSATFAEFLTLPLYEEI